MQQKVTVLNKTEASDHLPPKEQIPVPQAQHSLGIVGQTGSKLSEEANN